MENNAALKEYLAFNINEIDSDQRKVDYCQTSLNSATKNLSRRMTAIQQIREGIDISFSVCYTL